MENQGVRRQLARRVWWLDHSVGVLSSTVIGVVLILLMIGPLYTAWDAGSSPMLSAQGTVLSYTSDNLLIRLGKTSVAFHNNSPLRPGDPVQVFYQVGRSGRIYVASANPILRKNARG